MLRKAVTVFFMVALLGRSASSSAAPVTQEDAKRAKTRAIALTTVGTILMHLAPALIAAGVMTHYGAADCQDNGNCSNAGQNAAIGIGAIFAATSPVLLGFGIAEFNRLGEIERQLGMTQSAAKQFPKIRRHGIALLATGAAFLALSTVTLVSAVEVQPAHWNNFVATPTCVGAPHYVCDNRERLLGGLMAATVVGQLTGHILVGLGARTLVKAERSKLQFSAQPLATRDGVVGAFASASFHF